MVGYDQNLNGLELLLFSQLVFRACHIALESRYSPLCEDKVKQAGIVQSTIQYQYSRPRE